MCICIYVYVYVCVYVYILFLYRRWPKYSLHGLVQQLAAAGNYICYYSGSGRLWRVTGCWDSLYEMHQWSNLICVGRRDKWFPVLERYRVSNVTAILELKRLGLTGAVFAPDDKGVNHTCNL